MRWWEGSIPFGKALPLPPPILSSATLLQLFLEALTFYPGDCEPLSRKPCRRNASCAIPAAANSGRISTTAWLSRWRRSRDPGFSGIEESWCASLALILGITVVAAWLWQQNRRVHWVHTVALTEISQIIDRDRLYAALRLIQEARLVLPEDPELERLFSQVSVPMSIETSPLGADIYLRDYSSQAQEWEFLGVSPVPRVYLPFAAVRWRIARDGHEPLEAASSSVASGVIRFRLEAEGSRKPGMVPVPGGFFSFGGKRVELEDYRLDRFEVSNEEYKRFFDSGGYETPEYWEQRCVAERRSLSREEAVRKMVDRTGRTGPPAGNSEPISRVAVSTL